MLSFWALCKKGRLAFEAAPKPSAPDCSPCRIISFDFVSIQMKNDDKLLFSVLDNSVKQTEYDNEKDMQTRNKLVGKAGETFLCKSLFAFFLFFFSVCAFPFLFMCSSSLIIDVTCCFHGNSKLLLLLLKHQKKKSGHFIKIYMVVTFRLLNWKSKCKLKAENSYCNEEKYRRYVGYRKYLLTLTGTATQRMFYGILTEKSDDPQECFEK